MTAELQTVSVTDPRLFGKQTIPPQSLVIPIPLQGKEANCTERMSMKYIGQWILLSRLRPLGSFRENSSGVFSVGADKASSK